MKKKLRQFGFTLLELLVVIAIIAVLAAIIMAALNTSRAKAADGRTKTTMSNVRATIQDEKNSGAGFNTILSDSQSKATQQLQALATQSGESYKYYADTDTYAVVFPLKSENGYWCVDANGVSKKVAADAPTGTVYNCSSFGSGGGQQQLPPGTIVYSDNTTGTGFEINIMDSSWNSTWGYTWNNPAQKQVTAGTGYTIDIMPIVFGNYTYSLSCPHATQWSNNMEAMFTGVDISGTCTLSFH